jgi:predicted nucleic acid-binding protein
MSESVFIDTGYILALVNENDQHHAEALVLSEHYDGRSVVVTDAVLLEIGNALSRMDRRPPCRSFRTSGTSVARR